MPHSRQLHLGAFMRPVSLHNDAWRFPGANFNFRHLKRFVQTQKKSLLRRVLHGRSPRGAEQEVAE
jgi:hypothetical protein